jgi:putative transcriptional regulator
MTMSKQALDSIMAGLQDALAYAKGDRGRGRTHIVKIPAVDVRKARKKLGMSQDAFARNFGVSVATVRNWEQGRREPEGAARVLLRVIQREPEAVRRALAPAKRRSRVKPGAAA